MKFKNDDIQSIPLKLNFAQVFAYLYIFMKLNHYTYSLT